MDRLNPEGIPRDELRHALATRRHVAAARRRNECLLCRAKPVNEAGLCEVCHSQLDDEELRLAERWLAGREP